MAAATTTLGLTAGGKGGSEGLDSDSGYPTEEESGRSVRLDGWVYSVVG